MVNCFVKGFVGNFLFLFSVQCTDEAVDGWFCFLLVKSPFRGFNSGLISFCVLGCFNACDFSSKGIRENMSS